MNHDLLKLARNKCDLALRYKEKMMKDTGIFDDGINLLNRRYFIGEYHKVEQELNDIIFSDLMAMLCLNTIGTTAYFKSEQFVVKFHDPQSVFTWHQDSGYSVYMGGAEVHEPYVAFWVALDDMTKENGTISLLPFDRAGGGKLVKHKWSEYECYYES